MPQARRQGARPHLIVENGATKGLPLAGIGDSVRDVPLQADELRGRHPEALFLKLRGAAEAPRV